jgi:hypothetical protein
MKHTHYRETCRSFIVLEVNHEKTKYVFMSYEQKKVKVVPVHDIKEYGNLGITPLIHNLNVRWR